MPSIRESLRFRCFLLLYRSKRRLSSSISAFTRVTRAAYLVTGRLWMAHLESDHSRREHA